jgi:hypothetical protein
MGWLIDLAKAAIPEPMSAGGANPDPLPSLPAAEAAILPALAHPDLSGVPSEFAARLSPEDLDDIAAGDIPLGTVQAFEQAAIAREAEDLKEAFEERAGILEFDAALPRAEAELESARITATLARNRGYLWASLRGRPLSRYPVLAAQLPDRPGPVDALPLGLPTVAVLKDKRVLRGGRRGAGGKGMTTDNPRACPARLLLADGGHGLLRRRCAPGRGLRNAPLGGGRACGSGRCVMRKRTSGAATINPETASRQSSEKEGINSETVQVRR